MSTSGAVDEPAGASEMTSARAKSVLLPFFEQALRGFQRGRTTFSVLCSVSGSSSSLQVAAHTAAAPPRSLLVLDSSFNPPTLAHQRMVSSALVDDVEAIARDGDGEGEGSRILLLLAINNADKAPKPAVFPQRLTMMYLFALDLLHASSPSSTRGLGELGGKVVDIAVTTEPYFHNKSAAIASSEFYQAVGSSSSSSSSSSSMEQVYLTGFDTLIRIFNPKYYPDNSLRHSLDPFFGRSTLRVTMRTDADWGDADDQRAYLEELRDGKLEEELEGQREWLEKVQMVPGRASQHEVVISSTKVRDAVQRKDWDALGNLVSPRVVDYLVTANLYS